MPAGTLSFASSRALYAAAARSRAWPASPAMASAARRSAPRRPWSRRGSRRRPRARQRRGSRARARPRRRWRTAARGWRRPHRPRRRASACRAGPAGRGAAADPRSAARRSAASARGPSCCSPLKACFMCSPSRLAARRGTLRRAASAHLGSRGQVERPRGEPAAARELERARTCALSCGTTSRHDRELVHAQAHQHRHRERVRGQPAADRDRTLAARPRPRPSRRSGAAPPGAGHRGCAASSGCAAIHRERVLREVVGADREEVGHLASWSASSAAAGVSIITPSCGRPAMPSSAASSLDQRAHARDFGGSVTIGSMMRHCRQRPDAQDRAQLRAQQLRLPAGSCARRAGPAPGSPRAAAAGRRSACRRRRRACGSRRGRPPKASTIALVLARLLVLVRRGRAIEEQELGAQQAAAFGAACDGAAPPPPATEVGEDCDARAVGRARSRAAPLRSPAARVLALRREHALGAAPSSAAGRIDPQEAVARHRAPAACPRRSRARSAPAPTSVGMPIAAARIATCEVGAAARGARCRRCGADRARPAARAAARRRARCARSGSARAARRASPASAASTCDSRSSRSSARSRSRASPSSRKRVGAGADRRAPGMPGARATRDRRAAAACSSGRRGIRGAPRGPRRAARSLPCAERRELARTLAMRRARAPRSRCADAGAGLGDARARSPDAIVAARRSPARCGHDARQFRAARRRRCLAAPARPADVAGAADCSGVRDGAAQQRRERLEAACCIGAPTPRASTSSSPRTPSDISATALRALARRPCACSVTSASKPRSDARPAAPRVARGGRCGERHPESPAVARHRRRLAGMPRVGGDAARAAPCRNRLPDSTACPLTPSDDLE